MTRWGKWVLCAALTLCAASLCAVGQANPRRTDFKLDLDLLQAAHNGETWKVRDLLNKGANVNARDGQFNWTPLMWAAERGHLGTVRYLLGKGAQVNARSANKGRPVIVLIEGRASATQPVATGDAAPADAATMAVLQTQSAFVTENNGVTALLLAASGGYNLTAKELLNKGAEVNARTASGDTALMAAAFKGYLPTVRTLLARGADVHARDGFGGTALVSAVLEGHTPVVKELLAKGASPNVQWQNVSLLRVARYYNRGDIVSLLRRAGATDAAPRRTIQKARQKTQAPPRNAPRYPAPGPGVVVLN